MALFIGTGRIDPSSLKFDPCELSVQFALQDGPARYDVESHGIEQYRVLESIRPRESMLVVGAGEQRTGPGRPRLVIRPRLLLPLAAVGLDEKRILLQVIESHLDDGRQY